MRLQGPSQPVEQGPAVYACQRLRAAESRGKARRQHDAVRQECGTGLRCYHRAVKKEYATLRRKPFLTPVWLAALGALAAFLVVVFMAWNWITATSTMVVVVRHAEKRLDAGDDPDLNAAGEARAALLARMFGDGAPLGRLDAIFVSHTRRSHETAAPLEKRLGLTATEGPQDDVASLTRLVMRGHQGGRVLIVAHSDTVPQIIATLADLKSVPPIGDDEYGTMYVVTVPRIGHANVLRLSY